MSGMTVAHAERYLRLYARGKGDSHDAEKICKWLPANHPQDAARIAADWWRTNANYQCKRQHQGQDTVAVSNVCTWSVSIVYWLVEYGAAPPESARCEHGSTFPHGGAW
jgi:hypothetical protein